MSSEARRFYEQGPARMSRARSAMPDTARGFGGMFQAVMKEGAISLREKELIALAIGLSVRCESCIYAHVEKALRAGAGREQILEAAGVAVMMQGGPTYTYLPRLIEALDALETPDAA